MENIQKWRNGYLMWVAVIESKYNLLIFETFAKISIMRQKQDYQSNMLYANPLCKLFLRQQN